MNISVIPSVVLAKVVHILDIIFGYGLYRVLGRQYARVEFISLAMTCFVVNGLSELGLVKLFVYADLGKELIVRSLFFDDSVFDDHYTVCL